MCWCTPGKRTPCCGSVQCHALSKSKPCPFCKPPRPEAPAPEAPKTDGARRETVLWRDIWYACRFTTKGTTWTDFVLCEVAAMHSGKASDVDGVPMFDRKGSKSSLNRTENLDEAEPAAEGFIKWDGCMQFTSGHQHFDNRADVDRYAEALHRIRDKAIAVGGDAELVGERDVKYESEAM